MGSKILLLGSNGQLGSFAKHFLPYIGETICLNYPDIDFTKPNEVTSMINAIAPDVVFNSVAYTNVDKAEEEYDLCKIVNTTTPGEIAKLSSSLDFLFVHFSTDFVFSGKNRNTPYTELDTPDPINKYGSSKLKSEEIIQQNAEKFFILRTSWLYSKRKTSFVGKVMNWARKMKTLRIVEDQVGSPTSAFDLSNVTMQAIKTALDHGDDWIRRNAGVYHLGGVGTASRFEWAKKILELDPNRDTQIVEEILPARSSDFHTTANRPEFSPLDCSKFKQTFGVSLPAWESSLNFLMSKIHEH